MERDELIGIGQVANRFRVSPVTVRNWERGGLLPPAYRVDVVGRRVWRTTEVEAAAAAIAERRATTRPGRPRAA